MTKVFMETRRVQKAGKGSYTLNLPLWWVKENKLEKGDRIDIYKSKSGSLLLKPNLDFHTTPFMSREEQPEDEGIFDFTKKLKEIG